MKVSFLSLFPQLYTHFLLTSLIHKAQKEKIIDVDVCDLLSYSTPKKRVDGPSCGPGVGMVIRPEIIERAIESQENIWGRGLRIFFSPQGTPLTQKTVRKFVHRAVSYGHIMLVAGRYEGIDARAEAYYADELVSVGDFVLLGGDLPAQLFFEAFVRHIPGVVGQEASVQNESFSGPFFDYPAYTKPVVWKKQYVVPEVLLSGNHKKIAQWREKTAAHHTITKRFDWVQRATVSPKQAELVASMIPSHYIALMHTDVLIGKEKKEGTTSVTSIDIHDIARSARTYNVKKFFIVTPLADQQAIVHVLLDFWKTDVGIQYNYERHDALRTVCVVDDLSAVLRTIEQEETKSPLVITTSALNNHAGRMISYHDQSTVWQQQKPVLFVFGTGRGLQKTVLEQSDYTLLPIKGFSSFNHLSVRSAVAIILDRWLGSSPLV